MTESGLDAMASRLQEITAELAEMERLVTVFLTTNARMLGGV